MGIHSGTPLCQSDPVTGRMDYFGKMVNRAARIAAIAHGGQLVVSSNAWEVKQRSFYWLILKEIKNDETIIDITEAIHLGTHSLKGIADDTQIIQLLPMSLKDRPFPPLKSVLEASLPKISEHMLSTK